MKYRIDHLAFRTLNREKSVDFFINALGFVYQETFEIYFNEEKTDIAICTVLSSDANSVLDCPWVIPYTNKNIEFEYHRPPEIFISEGSVGSIVHTWAMKRGGGGLHHIALQVEDDSTVDIEMKKWLDNGWCEGFTSEVFHCDDMYQVFTKPSELTGVVFELIKRKEHGFCKSSVKNLMLSTKGD